MTRKAPVWPSSLKPTVVWGSRSSVTVIERSARVEADWQVVSVRPARVPPEGASVDDVIAQLGLESEVTDVRREMGEALTDAAGISLRSLRLRAGLSQRELGERLGMPQSNVARLERHPGDIGLTTLRRLCEALGVDMNTIDKALP